MVVSVEVGEMEEWQTRHSRSRKKEKGDVGVEKRREKNGEFPLFGI